MQEADLGNFVFWNDLLSAGTQITKVRKFDFLGHSLSLKLGIKILKG
jgi:hypothetical protein